MPKTGCFLAYPSANAQIAETITLACETASRVNRDIEYRTWPESDIAGQFIATTITDDIESAACFAADITFLNFNVIYEIGFAIGRSKPVLLVRSRGFQADDDLVRSVGLFDTIGYRPYTNVEELVGHLRNLEVLRPLSTPSKIDRKSPLFVVLPANKTEDEIRIISRIKKARIGFRTFDPEEEGRMAAPKVISSVMASVGVIAPLIGPERANSTVHNSRCAFVAGLSHGLGRDLLLMQRGEQPIPIDYRDLTSQYLSLEQIDQRVSDFAPRIYERSLGSSTTTTRPDQSVLATITLGASAAENEFSTLGKYFLRTHEFDRLLRGEAQLVVGRKGSGKTALFGQLRDELRRDKHRIVLDLKPEGFRLLQFKEIILDRVQDGTKQNIMTAFWEYLIYLEICHKLLDKDEQRHTHDHTIYPIYNRLAAQYYDDAFVAEGDFAERMSRLLDRVADQIEHRTRGHDAKTTLTSPDIMQALYHHDIQTLRTTVTEYLAHKHGLWILFDNLDKGWPAHGLTDLDIISFRALLDAIARIRDHLQNRDQQCTGIIFVRNDVYEWIIRGSSDRGKISHVLVDWSDGELLREVLRRRILLQGDPREFGFMEAWSRICCSHINGEETSQYLIERSLMRPRGLIDLVQFCRSHALNLGRSRIEEDDIREGEESYSTELVNNISYEMRDIIPNSYDVLYRFLGRARWPSHDEVVSILSDSLGEAASPELTRRTIELLLWYGVLGVVRPDTSEAYIYNVRYDIRRLEAIEQNTGNRTYCVNPALWRGLEIAE